MQLRASQRTCRDGFGLEQPQEETLDAELEPLFSIKSEQQVCSHPQAQAPATLMSGRQQHSRLLLAQVVTVHFKFVISTLPLQ